MRGERDTDGWASELIPDRSIGGCNSDLRGMIQYLNFIVNCNYFTGILTYGKGNAIPVIGRGSP
jgi:hypothetical protein